MLKLKISTLNISINLIATPLKLWLPVMHSMFHRQTKLRSTPVRILRTFHEQFMNNSWIIHVKFIKLSLGNIWEWNFDLSTILSWDEPGSTLLWNTVESPLFQHGLLILFIFWTKIAFLLISVLTALLKGLFLQAKINEVRITFTLRVILAC